jgi:hypothetical protein
LALLFSSLLRKHKASEVAKEKAMCDNVQLLSFLDSRRDCVEQFGQEANMAITQDDQMLCVTEYSRIVPLENGEVISFGKL